MRTRLALLCILGYSGLSAQGDVATQPVSAPAAYETAWASEENVARMCDARIKWLMPRLENAYGLSAEQKVETQLLLEELKRRQITITIETAAQRMELAKRLRGTLHALRDAGGSPADLPATLEADRAILQEMNARSPLFHVENALTSVETLLPEKQRQPGRQRFKQLEEIRVLRALDHATTLAKFSAPDDAWERFVKRFCDVFDLNEAQRSTAASILRETLRRRAQSDARAGTGPDESVRQESLRRRSEPLWHQMLSRLDTIPTEGQVEKVQRSSAQGTTATRPTDYLEDRWLPPPTSAPAAR